MSRHKETGAALHCGEWAVVPGGAGRRRISGDKRKDRQRSKTRDCQAGPGSFRTDGRQKANCPRVMADELGLVPDLDGMSLPEVGLALKPNLLAPRSEQAASVVNFVFAAQRPRAGVSPFRSRFAPQRLKIALVGGRKGSTSCIPGRHERTRHLTVH